MSTAAARPDPFPVDGWKRAGWVLLAAYVVYAAAQMDVSWDRVVSGLHNARHFFERLFPPNFSRWDLLIKGLAESLQIAVLASALGIALSLPIGLAASRNLVPAWMSWPARLLIVAARSFHPVIVAILFVKAVGFGALAGILALALASIGFTAKLFAAFQRFDYDFVCAILISIIALIMLGELLATGVRAIFIDGASIADLFRRSPGAPAGRHERLPEDD